jgi:hypothetical protein
LHRPRPNPPNAPPGTPPPYDPIAAIPPNELFNHPTDVNTNINLENLSFRYIILR